MYKTSEDTMVSVLKLDIFELMDILFWDDSGHKKHINGKYEPESKKHQKQGDSSKKMGHGESSGQKEDDEDGESTTKDGDRHMGNKHNRGY